MMPIIEVKEQCKGCFHFQVCASVLKKELLIREIMLNEKDPKCEQYVSANGVTMQKWIPVAERLPECFKSVLVRRKTGLIGVDFFITPSLGWAKTKKGKSFPITHWMPLPSTEGLE